jgi:hypothetical protein
MLTTASAQHANIVAQALANHVGMALCVAMQCPHLSPKGRFDPNGS